MVVGIRTSRVTRGMSKQFEASKKERSSFGSTNGSKGEKREYRVRKGRNRNTRRGRLEKRIAKASLERRREELLRAVWGRINAPRQSLNKQRAVRPNLVRVPRVEKN